MSKQSERYGFVAMILHWTTALVVLALIVLGVVMVNVKVDFGTKFQLYQLHKSLGVTVFALTLLRIVWRLMHPAPPLPSGLNAWEARAAHVSHALFYFLLLVLPLSGWARVSAATFNIETVLFGVVPLPHIAFLEGLSPDDKKAFEPVAQSVHFALGLSMVILVCLHIAGAIKHQFDLGPKVLYRMWPFAK